MKCQIEKRAARTRFRPLLHVSWACLIFRRFGESMKHDGL